MKHVFYIVILFFFSFVIFGFIQTPFSYAQDCAGTPVTFLNAQLKPLPLGEQYGRPGTCIIPTKIVLHTTDGGPEKVGQTMDQLYNDLANSNTNKGGVSVNFLVDEKGNIMQLVPMYQSTSETTRGVANYNNDAHNEQISIEMMSPQPFAAKSDVPKAQYDATIALIQALMKQYNIPLGDHDASWTAPSDSYTADSGSGVFGHYQLNPQSKPDPGVNFMPVVRADLLTLGNAPASSSSTSASGDTSPALSNCSVVKVGKPAGPPPPCNTSTSGNSPTNDGTHPVVPPVQDGDFVKAVKNKFDITLVGYDQQHAKWVWEKFWDVSNTNFPTLVKGVTATNQPGSQQLDNNSIIVEGYGDEQLFKVVFIHELGHIIRHRTDDNITDVENAILAEGYVTNYAQNANSCTGSDSFNEDYAEMIAYYLNPASPSITARCSDRAANTYQNGNHPIHYAIAKSILGNY
jgi:hypothetical protein